MKIVLTPNETCQARYRNLCCICNEHFEVREVQAWVVETDDKNLIGEHDPNSVCLACLAVGADGMKERARQAAERQDGIAYALREFANELEREQIIVPDMAAVEELREEYDNARSDVSGEVLS